MDFTRSFQLQSFALVLLLAGSVFAQNCVLTVPPNPLSATGLATPYTVSGCNQIDFSNQGVFVEAAIYNPSTNQISVYHPLVVNQGAVAGRDFIKPIAATVPQGATVGIWFGTNAATVTLAGNTNGCVNGLSNSVFGQVSGVHSQSTGLGMLIVLTTFIRVVCTLQWGCLHEGRCPFQFQLLFSLPSC